MAKRDGYNPYKENKGGVPEVEENQQRIVSGRGQIIIASVLAVLGLGLGFLLNAMNFTGMAVLVIAGIYAVNCWIAMVMKFGLKSSGATAVAFWTAIAIVIYSLLTGSFG